MMFFEDQLCARMAKKALILQLGDIRISNVSVRIYFMFLEVYFCIFQVFIDSAYNIPDQDSPVRMVTPSTEVLIALSPERTYSTSGVKSFTPEQRQCYFHDEVKNSLEYITSAVLHPAA